MTEKTKIHLEIVTFSAKKVKIKCSKHGWVKVKRAYDPFLKKMTAMSCIKCPTITKINYKDHE